MTDYRADEHDLSLQHDLRKIDQQVHQRRQTIGWLLSGSTAAVVADCGDGYTGTIQIGVPV